MSIAPNPHRAWGIGLGRTGTTSFCEALRILGYQNVVHNPRFASLKNLDGAADAGCTIFYKYLDHKFPDSKFVLTVRDLDAWLESIQFILGRWPVSIDNDEAIMRRMLTFETVSFDRDKMIAAYHRHREDVERYFRDRPGDLLVMDISAGDGWETLCPFLGVPVPQQPFPHSHARGDAAVPPAPPRLIGRLARRLRTATRR